jgi:hypothetical protein
MLKRNYNLNDKKSSDQALIDQARKIGVDVEALMDNIERTPAERIRRHQIALDTFMKIKNAKFI